MSGTTLSIHELVIRAFIGGIPASEGGMTASVMQFGPVKTFAFFEGDNVVYEAVINVETLEVSVFDQPETPKALVVQNALFKYIAQIKKARDRKNNVEQCRTM